MAVGPNLMASSAERPSALLRWFEPSMGGRTILPTGPTFAALAVFLSTSGDYEISEPLSIFVHFVEPIDPDTRSHPVEITFVSPDASEFLRKGARFELREGADAIAEGEILDVPD